MTIIFFPDYSETNPYQSNLADALDERVVFGETRGLIPILRSVRAADNVSTLHFHWLAPYVLADSSIETAGRLILTLLQLLVIRAAGIRVVWTVHNVVSHESPHPQIERGFKHVFLRLGLCQGLFVHCEAVSETVIKEYRLPGEIRPPVTVIPHGHYINNYENKVSEADSRAALGIDSDATVYLFFGQVRPYKGVPELITAFGELNDANARLLVVGDPSPQRLEQQVRRRVDATDHVRAVLEFVPDEEVQTYMNAADVAVFPYRHITTSGGIVLAMSFARAVVAPRLGCLPELLDDDGSIQYDPRKDDSLNAALAEAGTRDLHRMGNHNKELVMQNDWTEIAAITHQVYAGGRSQQE